MKKTEIYLLKEFYQLDSGERSFYVESYASKDEAVKSFRKKIEELINEQGYKTVSTKVYDCVDYLFLIDAEGNEANLEVEVSLLNESDTKENKRTLFLDELDGEKIIATTSEEDVHKLEIAIKDFITNYPEAQTSDILDYFELVEVDYDYFDLT